MISLAKDLIKYGAIAGIIAYLLLGVVRPLLKTMLPAPTCRASHRRRRQIDDVLAEKRAKNASRMSRPPPSCSRPSSPKARELAKAGPATGSQHHQGMDGCQWRLTTASRRAPSC
jgi:hypothetical protein